jgi:hypothetical protein
MSEDFSEGTITIRCHYLLCVSLHLTAHLFVVKVILDLCNLLLELTDLSWIALLSKLDFLLSDKGVLLCNRVLSLVICCELGILILISLY